MKQRFLPSARTILLSAIAAAAALPAAAQVSGSIQTTLPSGATANGNIYPSKAQVFLTAGPQNQKASGLPDGLYYFQVTDPSGATLLSNDPAICRQVVVSGGRLAGVYDSTGCEHASIAIATTSNAPSGAVAVQAGGAFHTCPGAATTDTFCDTTNPGGEYKIWLIAQSSAVPACNTSVNPDGLSLSFDQKCAKTGNFKLSIPAVSHVVACTFNDLNANGVLDPNELMVSGWPITASVAASSYVTLRSDNQAGSSITATTDSTGCVSFAASGISGQVAVTLTEASQPRWTQTAPANGTYDASGNPALTGPTSVSGAAGIPASGGIISVSLVAGATVTAPSFGNTDPDCPDCSILGSITLLNAATPEKLYTWGITKSVDKSEIDDVAPSGSATFNYTVSVTHDSGAGSLLAGIITVINADPSNPSVTLNVVDAVSDSGTCRIQDPATQQYVPEVFNLTVNSFTEATLPYQCTYSGAAPAAGTNTVTATNLSNSSAPYTSAASYNFSTATTIADQTASITDTLKGTLGTVSYTDASPRAFQYSYTFSGDPTGTCTNHNNTASFTTATTSATASASQSVKVCVKNPFTITAAATPVSVVLINSTPAPLKDSATLSGGTNPTGTLTFTLKLGGQTVDTETVTVNGNGTYKTPTGHALPTTSTIVGIYQWSVSYSGDTNNSPFSETAFNFAEMVQVFQAVPDFTLTQSFGARDPNNGDVTEGPATINANLFGGYNPTGTITFTLIDISATTPVCTRTVTVNGNGNYQASCNPNFSDNSSEYWVVTYSGDGNNNTVTRQAQSFFPVA